MKQRKTIRTLAIAAAALALLVGLPTLAQQGEGPPCGMPGHGPHGGPHGGAHGGPGGPGPHHLARLANELGLSEEQREQVRGIVERYHSGELGEAMREMAEARRTVQDVVHDATADEQQVREALAPISALAEKTALLQHQMSVEIDAVFTEEQRAKAKELREQRPDRRAERRGHGRGYRGKGGPPLAD